MIKTIGVLTSGGDAPGMNAAIRAVVRTGRYYNKQVVGVRRGYQGLIEGDFQPLDSRSVKQILSLGGTFLKTARSQEFRTPEGRQKAYDHIKAAGIDALVVIGGDGSFTGAHIISEETGIPVVGIPGTIDNDLYGTDFTIGYDTATNVVVEAVDKIRDTANSHDRMFFVEVMGRDTGFIALRTAVATGALDVILPEENQPFEDLVAAIEKAAKTGKTSNIIIVAEGNRLGSTFEIAERVGALYPNLETKVTILGHIQRGGSPTCYDRILASKLGVAAVEGLLNGKTDVMAGVTGPDITFTFLQKAIQNKAPLNLELLRISKILAT
jgi:6-phosphofructokinase 1